MEAVPVHEILKAARIDQGLSQADLARRIGRTQPQISMFESGKRHALSMEKVREAAEVLGVDLIPLGVEASRRPPEVPYVCPGETCQGNVPVQAAVGMAMRPTLHLAERGRTLHCPECREVLLSECSECGAGVSAGAFCVACGAPYVTVTADRGGLDAWAREHLSAIREARELTAPRRHDLSARTPGGVGSGTPGRVGEASSETG